MANSLKTIKLKRGLKTNLPTLNVGEPAFVSDEGELYIGTSGGNIKLTSKSELADKSSHYVTLSDFKRQGGETDDTARIGRAIAYAKANGIGLIIFPKTNYSVISETLIDFGDIDIDFCGSTFTYSGTNSYIYDDVRSVFKFTGSVTATFTDGVISYTPRINYSDSIKKGYSSMVVTQALYDAVSAGGYLYIKMFTMLPPYNNAETPMVRVLARVVKKDTGNVLIVAYDSPYQWGAQAIVSQTIKVVNPIKNITIRNLNLTHAVSSVQMIGGIATQYCSNVKIENCLVEKHHLPAYWINASENVTTDNCTARYPQYTSSGQGYHTQAVDCQHVHVREPISINCRHTVDFSGGCYLRVTNSTPQIDTDNPTEANMLNSFDCHGVCEHTITFDNCNGNFTFGNGRTQFVELIDNVKIINSDVKNLSTAGLKNIKISNCEVSFDQGTALTMHRVLIENSTVYANTLGLLDFRGDVRTPSSKSFFKMQNCFIKFLDIGDFGNVSLANEQFRFLNYNNVYMDNVKLIEDVTNGINIKATCDVFEVTNSRLMGYIRTLCTKKIKIKENTILQNGIDNLIYLDNTNLTGLVNIEIAENTFDFSTNGTIINSNSQGAGTLKNLLRFQNNTILNNSYTVDYYLQAYANLTWKVISKNNAVMVAPTNAGTVNLFPDADSTITI